MKNWLTLILTVIFLHPVYPQETAFRELLADSAMRNADVSFVVIDAEGGFTIFEYNPDKSLIPASVLKLITSAAALEVLGPEHKFSTKIGYAGILNPRNGLLKGDVIIKGGGDPSLGSAEFGDYYAGFEDNWVSALIQSGIKRIRGKVITDDSYFDYQPVPSMWLWEDIGNYYGAGAYGLSVYDNTYEIHIRSSSDSSGHLITGVVPSEIDIKYDDFLTVSGEDDEGYVFASPYSNVATLSGIIPANRNDFILKASIPDPPLLMAEMIDRKLRSSHIKISEKPSTTRMHADSRGEFVQISEVLSPPLKEIIRVLNHESVNLYAEHLLKETGRRVSGEASTVAGTEAVMAFLRKSGIPTDGIFLEDGSGLSPFNAVSARGITNLLYYMRNKSIYSPEYFSSLPIAGKEGTLSNYFTDTEFTDRLYAKSGSMTRVRSYAGCLTTYTGNDMIFCIIVNNFTGPSRGIVAHIEEILKEIIIIK